MALPPIFTLLSDADLANAEAAIASAFAVAAFETAFDKAMAAFDADPDLDIVRLDLA